MPDTIGQRLKQAREERNLPIEKVEQFTRIRAYYLNALEADDYSGMPSAAQARGFLRNYASFLEMNIDEVLLELQRAQTPQESEQLAGPLPVLDSSSALPKAQETREPAPPFWTSILNRFKKNDSAAETESPEPIPVDDAIIESATVEEVVETSPIVETEPESKVEEEPVQVEAPKKRGRKKKVYVTETSPTEEVKKDEDRELLVEIPMPVVVEEEPVEEAKPEVESPATGETEIGAAPSQPGFLARAMSIFSIRVNKPASAETQELEAQVNEEHSVVEEVEQTTAEKQSQPVEQEQVDVSDEAGPSASKSGLLTRVASLFRRRSKRSKPREQIQALEENVVESKPVAPVPNIPQQSAEEIFKEIGKELRKRRDMLSLTLDEVERHTRLRSVFLKAMEEGDFDKLPSPVQTRGMLANYVTFLDLDSDTIMLRFADALQARHRAKYPDKPEGSRPPMEVVRRLPPLRSFIAGDLLFGIGIVAVLFGLAFWGVQRIIAIQTAEQAFPTALSIPQILAGSPQAAESQQADLSSVAETPIGFSTLDATVAAGLPTIPANVNVQLNIVAVERTFMRVIVDGDVAFDGRVLPGTAYPFQAESQIEVLTGNGSALRVTYNGRDLGLMGSFGQVIDRVFTAVGIATPTATLPPTPTNTPPATPTLTGSETPTFTETPTITVTP